MQIASVGSAEFREMFERVDANGDRKIDFGEFSALVRSLDRNRPEAQLRPGFEALDTDRDGLVSYDEFCAWVSR